MMGVFVQVNEESVNATRFPIGYVIQENGCWEWVGCHSSGGYGAIGVWGQGRVTRAHRWMYERERGVIPKGMQIDHLCRNRGCVNPDHLEPVTHRENCARGASFSAINSTKMHCPLGHPLSDGNLDGSRARRGHRVCRTCMNLNNKRHRLKKKANLAIYRALEAECP